MTHFLFHSQFEYKCHFNLIQLNKSTNYKFSMNSKIVTPLGHFV